MTNILAWVQADVKVSHLSLEGGVCESPSKDVQDPAGKMGLRLGGVNLVSSAYSVSNL